MVEVYGIPNGVKRRSFGFFRKSLKPLLACPKGTNFSYHSTSFLKVRRPRHYRLIVSILGTGDIYGVLLAVLESGS